MSISSKNIATQQKKFGKHLKKLRIDRGLSQLDLATLCNMEKTAISRLENGRANFTFKTALILAKSLEIEVKELFDF